MIRRLFTALSLLSLLLCIGDSVLLRMHRSVRFPLSFAAATESRISLGWESSVFIIKSYPRPVMIEVPDDDPRFWQWLAVRNPRERSAFGFHWAHCHIVMGFGKFGRLTGTDTGESVRLTAPGWFTQDAALLLPLAWTVSIIRRRSRSDGDCRRCGYILTGNTSGVCPEFGISIAKQEKTSSIMATTARH